MKNPPIPPSAECEACQQRLSEIADAGGILPPEMQAHLDGCEACTQFAELWLPNPPAVLSQTVARVGDSRLRDRILEVAAPANVVPFPTPVSRAFPLAWLSRVAACLALAGLAYWLLNPTLTPVQRHSARPAMPTLAQGFRQMEDQTTHEQQTLQTALVDGGHRVQSDVAWSMSALEL